MHQSVIEESNKEEARGCQSPGEAVTLVTILTAGLGFNKRMLG